MNTLRKIFGSIMVLFLSIVLTGISTLAAPVAQAFSDVPYGSYYSEALNWALNENVIDNRELFYPAIPVKRAGMAKMTIQAMQVPLDASRSNPSFLDVPANQWYYPYIETGVSFGVFSGYTDYNGFPSGYFGPANNPTRAEAVATIMRAFGFGLTDAQCNVTFPDIDYGAWYGSYMDSACYYGILQGDIFGRARPADTINRAEFITMLHRAATYFEEEVPAVVDPEDTMEYDPIYGLDDPVVDSSTDPTSFPDADSVLMVDVAPSTPAPTMIPADAAAVNYATFAFTALGDDIRLNRATLWRQGLGSHNNFSEAWLSVDGFMVGSGRTFNSDGYANMNLGSDYIIIPEGQTVLVDVQASMASGVGANLQNSLGFRSDADLITDADSVQGTFPLFANPMTTSSYTVGSLEFSNDGNSTNIDVGAVQTTIGEFTLENRSDASEEFVISKMDFEINGSGGFRDIANAQIYYLGEPVTDSVTPIDDHLRFTFSDGGFVLRDGDNEDFKVKADVIGGDDSDTIRLQIDDDSDITAYVANSSRAYAVDVDRVNPANGMLATYTINAGNVTFARHSSSPSATDVPPETNGVTFLVAQLSVGADVFVEEMRVFLDASIRTKSDGTTAMDSTTCADPTQLQNLLKDKIDNVKIWNASRLAAGGESTLAAISAGSFSSPACTVSNAYYSFTDNFLLNAGLNLLSITADISRYVSAGETYSLSFDNTPSSWFTAEYYQNTDAIASTDINGSANGSVFTIEQANFTLARQDGYSDGESLVVGATDALFMTFKLEANDTGDIRVTNLTIEDGAADIEGTYITGVGIYEHGTMNSVVNGVRYDLGSDDTAQFSGLNITVPSGGFRLFDVRGSISTSWNTADNLQLFVTNVQAKDSQNNDATITYPNCHISGCSPNDAIASADFNVNSTAEVTIAFDSRADNNYDGMKTPTGNCSNYSCAERVAEFEIHPINDDITLNKLVLANDDNSANYASRFGTFFLVNEANGETIDTGSMSDSGGDGTITFDGFSYGFAEGDYHSVGVYASIQNITDLSQTGGYLKLYLPGVTSSNVRMTSSSIGFDIASSELTNNANVTDSYVQEYVTRKTKPTVTYNVSDETITGATSSDYEVYEFTITADSNGDVEWQRLTFDILETAGISSSDYKLYVKNQSTPLNATGVTVSGGQVVLEPDNIVQIPNGQPMTYVLKADINVTNPAASQTLEVTLTAASDTSIVTDTISALSGADFIWSDRADNISHSPTSADWTNGYLIDSFDTATKHIGYTGTGS